MFVKCLVDFQEETSLQTAVRISLELDLKCFRLRFVSRIRSSIEEEKCSQFG